MALCRLSENVDNSDQFVEHSGYSTRKMIKPNVRWVELKVKLCGGYETRRLVIER